MTLVVGYADEHIEFLIADSLLTPTMAHLVGQEPVSGEFHGLKVQIIDPNVAVGFSSNNGRAALDLISHWN